MKAGQKPNEFQDIPLEKFEDDDVYLFTQDGTGAYKFTVNQLAQVLGIDKRDGEVSKYIPDIDREVQAEYNGKQVYSAYFEITDFSGDTDVSDAQSFSFYLLNPVEELLKAEVVFTASQGEIFTQPNSIYEIDWRFNLSAGELRFYLVNKNPFQDYYAVKLKIYIEYTKP